MLPTTTTPQTSWIVQVYLLNGALIQNVTVSDPTSNSTMVTGLDPGEMYMMRVAGINTRGVGNYSAFATGQTYRGTFKYFHFMYSF